MMLSEELLYFVMAALAKEYNWLVGMLFPCQGQTQGPWSQTEDICPYNSVSMQTERNAKDHLKII